MNLYRLCRGLATASLLYHSAFLLASDDSRENLYKLKIYCASTKKWHGINHQSNDSLPLFKNAGKSPILARYEGKTSSYRVSSETHQFLLDECKKFLPKDTDFTLLGRDIDQSSTLAIKHKIEIEDGEYISRYYHAPLVKMHLATVNMIKDQWQDYLDFLTHYYQEELRTISHPQSEKAGAELGKFFHENSLRPEVEKLEEKFEKINSFAQLKKFLKEFNRVVEQSYEQISAEIQDQTFSPEVSSGAKQLRHALTQGIIELMLLDLGEGYFLSLNEAWSTAQFLEKMHSNLSMSNSLLEEFTSVMKVNKIASARMSAYLQNIVFTVSAAGDFLGINNEKTALPQPSRELPTPQKTHTRLPPPPLPHKNTSKPQENEGTSNVPIISAPTTTSAPTLSTSTIPPAQSKEPEQESSTPGTDRDALLAAIRKGIPLRHVSDPEKAAKTNFGAGGKLFVNNLKNDLQRGLEQRRKAITGNSTEK